MEKMSFKNPCINCFNVVLHSYVLNKLFYITYIWLLFLLPIYKNAIMIKTLTHSVLITIKIILMSIRVEKKVNTSIYLSNYNCSRNNLLIPNKWKLKTRSKFIFSTVTPNFYNISWLFGSNYAQKFLNYKISNLESLKLKIFFSIFKIFSWNDNSNMIIYSVVIILKNPSIQALNM